MFASRRIAGIGRGDADTYVLRRQEQGVVAATIRREFGTLTRMLRLAYKNGKLLRLPLLDKPKEGPPREGFFGDPAAPTRPDRPGALPPSRDGDRAQSFPEGDRYHIVSPGDLQDVAGRLTGTFARISAPVPVDTPTVTS